MNNDSKTVPASDGAVAKAAKINDQRERDLVCINNSNYIKQKTFSVKKCLRKTPIDLRAPKSFSIAFCLLNIYCCILKFITNCLLISADLAQNPANCCTLQRANLARALLAY